VTFEHGDVLDPPRDWRRDFDHVFCNPPFHDDDGERSPHAGRAVALQDTGTLGDWLAAGLKRVRAGGTMTAIIRADRIGETLGTLPCLASWSFLFGPASGTLQSASSCRQRRIRAHRLCWTPVWFSTAQMVVTRMMPMLFCAMPVRLPVGSPRL